MMDARDAGDGLINILLIEDSPGDVRLFREMLVEWKREICRNLF